MRKNPKIRQMFASNHATKICVGRSEKAYQGDVKRDLTIVTSNLLIDATIDIALACVGCDERSTDAGMFKPNLASSRKNLPDFSSSP